MGFPPWDELLIDREIQSSSGANVYKTLKGRPNLLVGNLNHTFDNFWKATEYVPPGCSGESIIRDFMTWDDCVPLSEISLLWNAKGVTPTQKGFYWCLDARAADFGEQIDFEIDGESTAIPINASHDRHVHVLSFFGGGFGGWTYGMKHLSAFHGVPAQVVAIESDLLACANYAANHDVPIINGYLPVSETLMNHMPKGCVIHGNVLSNQWMQAMAKWHPNILTISPPCQPWSGAGNSKGLATIDGMCFPEAILQARFLQPETIGIEQVTGFNTHDHRALVMKTISMIGYAVKWSKNIDFSFCGPVSRSRWIAILQRVCDIPPVDEIPPGVFQGHAGFSDEISGECQDLSDSQVMQPNHHTVKDRTCKNNQPQHPAKVNTPQPCQHPKDQTPGHCPVGHGLSQVKPQPFEHPKHPSNAQGYDGVCPQHPTTGHCPVGLDLSQVKPQPFEHPKHPATAQGSVCVHPKHPTPGHCPDGHVLSQVEPQPFEHPKHSAKDQGFVGLVSSQSKVPLSCQDTVSMALSQSTLQPFEHTESNPPESSRSQAKGHTQQALAHLTQPPDHQVHASGSVGQSNPQPFMHPSQDIPQQPAAVGRKDTLQPMSHMSSPSCHDSQQHLSDHFANSKVSSILLNSHHDFHDCISHMSFPRKCVHDLTQMDSNKDHLPPQHDASRSEDKMPSPLATTFEDRNHTARVDHAAVVYKHNSKCDRKEVTAVDMHIQRENKSSHVMAARQYTNGCHCLTPHTPSESMTCNEVPCRVTDLELMCAESPGHSDTSHDELANITMPPRIDISPTNLFPQCISRKHAGAYHRVANEHQEEETGFSQHTVSMPLDGRTFPNTVSPVQTQVIKDAHHAHEEQHEPTSTQRKKREFRRTMFDKDLVQIPNQTEPTQTPRSFQAIFPPMDSMDAQLYISDDMMQVVNNKEFLPAAKRRRITTKTPLQMRTCTQDETLPVIMAAYGNQHKLNPNMLKDKGCLAHFLHDDRVGPRLLHPCEIAMLHGVNGRFFAMKDFSTAWKILGNQITPVHAMFALTGACKLLECTVDDITILQVIDTWHSHRLKTTNSILNRGKAGYVIRHMIYDEDITDIQHENLHQFVQNHSKGLLPEGKFWDLDGFHDMHLPEDEVPANMTKEDLSQVTAIDPATPSGDLTPTQPFAVTLKAIIQSAKWTMPFWFASDVVPQDMPLLWQTTCDVQFVQGECHLQAGPQPMVAIDHNLVVMMTDQRLTVYAYKDNDFHSFCVRTCQTGDIFDQFGQVSPHMPFNQDVIIIDKKLQHGQLNIDIALAIAAFQNCTEVYQYDVVTDKWSCKLTGDGASRQIVAAILAKCITKESLHTLGKHVAVKHGETTTIDFGAAEAGATAPPSVFSTCVAVMMTRSMLDTLQTPDGVHITIKWKGRPLWSGQIDCHITAEVLTTLLMYTLSPVAHLREVRLIIKGKQFCSGDFQQWKQQDGNPPITVHLGFEMCGGAGQAATKSQLKQQVRNSIASWMLENNIELSWINSNLEKIIDDIGVKRFVPVIQQPSSHKRDSQMQQILKEAAIQLPEAPAKVQQANLNQKNKMRRKQVPFPEPQEFKVDCNYLLREDGTPVVQLQDFRCNATGVYLTNPQGATTWLRENQQLSTDELAMLILGPMPLDTSLPHEQIVIPCFNSDTQQVLLQATMVQFGAKKIQPKPWDQMSTKANSSKVCSLTLWKQDWSDEEWHAATHQTTQFLKEVFAHDGLKDAISSIWGRSYRKGKQLATFKDATSVQVHAAVHEEQFAAMLKLTGHNMIWAVPKNEDGRLTDDYRIVWLAPNVDHPKAATITAKVAGIAGLVRGKSSLGVRVTASMFSEAWKVIYPNERPPVDVANKYIYKLEPLPYGCNSAMLEEWALHVGWVMKPLRATGPKSWLVCTGDSPPAGPLAFNGNPVLPRFMPQKQSPLAQPILAGPRSVSKPTSAPSHTVATPNASQDPWWNYLHKNNQAPPIAPATTQGPIEQRFAQQDAKVQELENKIDALQQMQNQHTGQIQKVHQDLVNTEKQLVHTMHQSMEGVKQELAKTFGDALAKQSKQFENNFMDLKQALMSQPKRKSPAEKEDDMTD